MTVSAALPAPAPFTRPSLPIDRYWKLDYGRVDLAGAPEAVAPRLTIDDGTAAQGVILCSLAHAEREHRELLEGSMHACIADDETRFTAHAAAAPAREGFFCYVPPGVRAAPPLEIAFGEVGSWSGRGVIVLGAGAEVAIVEATGAAIEDALFCGMVEIVLAEGARLRYSVVQDAAASARSFFTRRALVAAGASVAFATAELGGLVSQSYVDARLTAPGARAEIGTIALTTGERYIDLGNDVAHAAPHTESNTIVKVAATHHGRGRYYGNIRMAPHAHGSDAMLRDDTLLLSPDAHIDSVPALEIAANDVKAFHGATVGNVDAEQLLYAMSRGLTDVEAERMITLGFFEPAIARFPEESLRESLRHRLAERVGR